MTGKGFRKIFGKMLSLLLAGSLVMVSPASADALDAGTAGGSALEEAVLFDAFSDDSEEAVLRQGAPEETEDVLENAIENAIEDAAKDAIEDESEEVFSAAENSFSSSFSEGSLPDLSGSFTEADSEESFDSAQDIFEDGSLREFESGETLYADSPVPADSAASVKDAYLAAGRLLAEMAGQSSPTVRVTKGEWMILGLARSGQEVPQGLYEKYLQNVVDKLTAQKGVLSENKYTEYSRVVLALTSIGADVTNIGGYNLLTPLADFNRAVWQGVNGAAFALIAFDSHDYPIPQAGEGAAVQTTREGLIQWILDREAAGGGWPITPGSAADMDTTSMTIQALAPYYQSRSDVKEAVERGLSRLSALQGTDGDFGSSEACSQLIVALTALGIDPGKDARFIKNGKTPLDVLLEYGAEGGGFCHLRSSQYNQMASEQAYYALTAYFRFLEGKTALFRMTDVVLDREAPGEGSGGETAGRDPEGGEASKEPSEGGDTIRVSFTLLGDEIHDSDKDGKAHTLKGENLDVWIPKTDYTVPAGATVKDLLEKALTENTQASYGWINPSGNYVETIIRNGVKLSEFSNGKNSGWMYMLNGAHPSLGVEEQGLKDQDTVIFHYTDNFVLEEHEHRWSEAWVSGASSHWHECEWDCGTKKDVSAHSWGSWKNSAASAMERSCSVCGKTETKKIKAVSFTVKAADYNKVTVTWTKAEGAAEYRVYRRVSGKKTWTQLSPNKKLTGTSYTDSSAVLGTTYEYTVQAYRKVNGKLVGDNYSSSGKKVKTVLGTVTMKKASAKDYASITVTWKSVSGATGYRLYRKKKGEKNWKELKNLTATSYTDKNLTTGTRYYYTVRAYRKVNGKAILSAKYNTTGISAVPTLKAAGISSLVTSSSHRNTIRWKKSAGATGYQVWCRVGNGAYKKVASIRGGGTSYVHKGLKKGKKYYYKIRAFRSISKTGYAYSAYSAMKGITSK